MAAARVAAPREGGGPKPVAVTLRLVDAEGRPVHVMRVDVAPSKLRAPLAELVARFARHYNRRRDEAEPPLDPNAVEASDAEGPLRLDVPVGNLVDALDKSPALDVTVRRGNLKTGESTTVAAAAAGADAGQPPPPMTKDHDDNAATRRPPSDAPDDDNDAAQVNEASDDAQQASSDAGPVVVRRAELPPPNDVLVDKRDLDALLARSADRGHADNEAVVVAVLFEKQQPSASASSAADFASAYKRMAHMFWPRAVLLRADVDDRAVRPLVDACGVRAAPTVAFFRNGAPVDQLVGGNEMQLNVKLCRWLADDEQQSHNNTNRGPRRDAWGDGWLAALRAR